jgi:hypothetical protein
VEQADGGSEIINVSKWMCGVIFMCAKELFMGCFRCAFEVCGDCERVGVGGG